MTKLIGTTKPTIASVRDRTHPNMQNLKPRHPVDLGLCTYAELEAASKKGLRAQGKSEEDIQAHKDRILENQEREDKKESANALSGFDFSNFLTKGGSSSNG
jgi:hypothetical protein